MAHEIFLPAKDIEAEKRDEKERKKFETERDIELLSRMAEMKKDPERFQRALNKLKTDMKVISSMEDLKGRIRESEDRGDSEEGRGRGGDIDPEDPGQVLDRNNPVLIAEALTNAVMSDGDEVPHRHTVVLDEQGNGSTDYTIGPKGEVTAHRHAVVGEKIQAVLGHTHTGTKGLYS